jgi:hypothetical protein
MLSNVFDLIMMQEHIHQRKGISLHSGENIETYFQSPNAYIPVFNIRGKYRPYLPSITHAIVFGQDPVQIIRNMCPHLKRIVRIYYSQLSI